ncbi:MAG TPA: 3-deoxy-manno-octulosonate cytidylyltransferase [Microvirga sp.]|nr:3-deoxy-manno-octulosonate cytidylyltransferase [Microvirga sp.]
MASPIVLIPARLAATRLPNKPLAEIGGAPMVVHTWRRAVEAGIGPVAVATDSGLIADAVRAAGGEAVMTRSDHPSGSDRIHEAVERLDPEGRHDAVVNVQGDFPTIDPRSIAAAVAPLLDPAVDIATLVCVAREDERQNPNVVKMIGTELRPGRFRSLYFTRATAPSGEGPLYHHIGVYAYRRRALARFVALPPSPRERRERLEQLRAVEAGMRIDAVLVDDVPFGVDTPEQLDEARRILAATQATTRDPP